MVTTPLIVVGPGSNRNSKEALIEATFMDCVTRLGLPRPIIPHVRRMARLECKVCERCTTELTGLFQTMADEFRQAHAKGGAACEHSEPYAALLWVLDRMVPEGRPFRKLRVSRVGDCEGCSQLPPPTGAHWQEIVQGVLPALLGKSASWKWEIDVARPSETGQTTHALRIRPVMTGGPDIPSWDPLVLTPHSVYTTLPWQDVQDRFEDLITLVACQKALSALWQEQSQEMSTLAERIDGDESARARMAQLEAMSQLFHLVGPSNRRLRRSGAAEGQPLPVYRRQLRILPVLFNLPTRVRFGGDWPLWAQLHAENTAALRTAEH